jgi:hypothetical protein
VIYIPSFIKIGSGIQKLIGEIHRHTGTWSHKPTLFFQNKESRLKIDYGILIFFEVLTMWTHLCLQRYCITPPKSHYSPPGSKATYVGAILYLPIDRLSYRYHNTRYVDPPRHFVAAVVCIGSTHVQLRRREPSALSMKFLFRRLFKCLISRLYIAGWSDDSWTGKDSEGGGSGLIKEGFQNLQGGTEENQEAPQSR